MQNPLAYLSEEERNEAMLRSMTDDDVVENEADQLAAKRADKLPRPRSDSALSSSLQTGVNNNANEERFTAQAALRNLSNFLR